MGNNICNLFSRKKQTIDKYHELKDLDEIIHTRRYKYINIHISRKVKQQLKYLGINNSEYIFLDYIIVNTLKNESCIQKRIFCTNTLQYKIKWVSPSYCIRDVKFQCVFTSFYISDFKYTNDEFNIEVNIESILSPSVDL